jgi:hypothetical protein
VDPSVRPLLVNAAPDGSSLILGEWPDWLVFEHEGHGPPEPVGGLLCDFWVTIADRPHVVFAGKVADPEPDVDRVQLQFPHHSQTCPIRTVRGHAVWMSFPEPFQSFEPPPSEPSVEPGAVVTATVLVRDGRVVASDQTPPLHWSGRWAGYAPC